MSFYSLLKLNPTPSMVDIEDSFDGNLCRCTGYRPILDSAKSFSADKSTNTSACNTRDASGDSKCKPTPLVNFTECKPYDPAHDMPFPESLLATQDSKTGFVMSRGNLTWLAPTTLSELLHAKTLFPHAKLIGGFSDVGIDMKFHAANYTTFINVATIQDLNSLTVQNNHLEIGASVTIASLVTLLQNLKHEPFQRTLIEALLSSLRTFGSRQIRNFATIGGNVITGKSMSDLNPILLANNATLTILSEKSGIRTVPVRDFYLSNNKPDLKPDEILLKVNIQLPSSDLEIVKSYKQYKRKEVIACFKVSLEQSGKVSSLVLALGGLASSTILIQDMAEKLTERSWNDEETLTIVQDELLSRINLTYSEEGGMVTFRRTLAVSFFTRFWYQTLQEVQLFRKENVVESDVGEITKGVSAGLQDVGDCDDTNDKNIGTVTGHVSGLSQATGVARYLDDMPRLHGELHVGFVLSKRAHALIKNVDASKALSLRGVHEFVTYKDVADPANNMFGFMKDEEIFASKEVNFHGKS